MFARLRSFLIAWTRRERFAKTPWTRKSGSTSTPMPRIWFAPGWPDGKRCGTPGFTSAASKA